MVKDVRTGLFRGREIYPVKVKGTMIVKNQRRKDPMTVQKIGVSHTKMLRFRQAESIHAPVQIILFPF